MREKKGGLCFLETSADVMVQGIAEKKVLTKRSHRSTNICLKEGICVNTAALSFFIFITQRNMQINNYARNILKM